MGVAQNDEPELSWKQETTCQGYITARFDEAVAIPRPSIKSAGRAHEIRQTPFSAGITHADRLHDGLNL